MQTKLITSTEEYISPTVLPNEPLTGWLKWNPGGEYDKIVLRFDLDFKVDRLFNVDVSNFKLSQEKGIIEIPKSLIQIDGFFGFGGVYRSKPESTWDLSFAIDFITKEDKKQTFSLSTVITRPIVEMISSPYDEIFLSNTSPIPSPIVFALRNKEVGTRIIDPTLVIDVRGTKNLQITIEGKHPPHDDFVILEDADLPLIDHIKVKGKGNAMIRFILEYKDDMSNKYSTLLKEIPIFAEQTQTQFIPVTHKIQTDPTMLLAA